MKQADSTVADDQAIYRIQRPSIDEIVTTGDIPLMQLNGDEWNFGIGKMASLIQRLNRMPVVLGEVAHIFQGLVTGADKVFIVGAEIESDSEVAKPYLTTGELVAYSEPKASFRIIFPYLVSNGKATLIPAEEMARHHSATWS